MARWIAGLVIATAVASCSGASSSSETTTPTGEGRSSDHAHRAVPMEAVDIDVGAERSGHSLVVNVTGVGRGHQSGSNLEDSKAWSVVADHDKAPLKMVLAGPAKISRQPTGAAFGDQWDIEVRFMVAFALPDNAGKVHLKVKAPTGETAEQELNVEAAAAEPAQVSRH